ncbi:facilitated trehalose transporter Tret1-like isoform X2 [Diorhabda sublineata]|uniref:facilitated trehalose transporter Tret1-like isoform X2 n=1 Tax=Diorhabda sublineata TaxID=1163346 RepID=UPI0024E0ED6C|nr:facilitated trehalose transporter Tret1-like isoform X2 [Diorhabda sublineata]
MDQPTPIQKLFRNANVFITGGTGFMGKILIEKLLRSTEVNTIYLLVREKKGKSIHTRIDELFEDVIFDEVKKKCPKFKHKIEAISGECQLSGLGLNITDMQTLISKVNIIFHVAATVRFDENIKIAYDINVNGIKYVIDLARKMTNLKSIVHVSTAYSNCTRSVIEEKIYDCPLSYEDVGRILEKISHEEADALTPRLLGEWPNTYTYTKALAENLVNDIGKGLPLAIFRPSIIVSTYKEPIPGWIDNLYGPTGCCAGVVTGVLRVLYCDPNLVADIVPIDTCVSALISIAWDLTTKKSDTSLPICFQYFVDNNDNEEVENRWRLLLKQTLVALGPLLLTTSAGMTFGYSAILLPQLESNNSTIVVNKVEMSWIGLFMVHLIGTFLTWKNTALICSILPLISQIIIHFVPESPIWLANEGRIAEAKTSFFWCRGRSEESNKELDSILQRRNQSPKDENRNYKEKFNEIFVPEFLKPLIILTVYVTTKQWCGINAIAFYSVAIMKDTVGNVDEYLATLLVDLIRVVMATAACFLIKNFKRRHLALISGIGTFVSLFFLSGVTFFVKIYPSNQIGYFTMLFLISYIVFVSIGLVPLPSSMNGELFPVKLKGLGCGVSSFVAFSMFYSVVQTTPIIFGNYGPSGGFLIFGLVAFVSTIFVYLFLPETKGKPLHEIEDAFKS